MTDADPPLRVVSDSRPRVTSLGFTPDREMALHSGDGWVVEVTAAYVVASRFESVVDPDDPEAEPVEVFCWPHHQVRWVHTIIPEGS